MRPIYKFELTIEETTERCYPIYKDDLAKDFELQSNQQFFRAKLSGKLKFESADYDRIVAAAFDTQFLLEIFISYNAGKSWTSYWLGTFWKTDCEFDEDTKTVQVTPTVNDRYNDVLAGMEKEYNLIELLPEIVPVKLDKRPMIQIYVPGESVIGCFLSGMWWEQEVTPESNESKLTEHGDGKLNFAFNKAIRSVEISQTGTPILPDVITVTPGDGQPLSKDGYTLYFRQVSEFLGWYAYIKRDSDNVNLWVKRIINAPTYPIIIEMNPIDGSGATGTVTVYIHDINVYARYICDAQTVASQPTYEIGADDIVVNNRNYKKVISYYFPDTIFFSSGISTTPTKWGIYQPGQYYVEPYVLGIDKFYPIARNAWGRVSAWFAFSSMDWIVERSGRKQTTIKDTFPLASVISVLLGKIAPALTHQANTEYSQFLYGDNPLLGISQTLLITPKSNIIFSGYDQPAQNAPITLKTVMDMLRDCFRCYWFVDEQNRFRIEHIHYFMDGGTYTGTPIIGVDLTKETVSRNGKPWAFGRNQYKFDKPEMASRYQFRWMDNVTQLFDGFPIEIISKYVNPDNIEEINIVNFTSDIDYILLNPSEISKDGFVLLSAIMQSGEYILPYITFEVDGTDYILQNGYVAFDFLQQYYAYDMPARHYLINEEQYTAIGIKKMKTQTLKFPMLNDPDLVQLVKTNIGNGMIQKLSVNLSSRNANATLKYDTE